MCMVYMYKIEDKDKSMWGAPTSVIYDSKVGKEIVVYNGRVYGVHDVVEYAA